MKIRKYLKKKLIAPALILVLIVSVTALLASNLSFLNNLFGTTASNNPTEPHFPENNYSENTPENGDGENNETSLDEQGNNNQSTRDRFGSGGGGSNSGNKPEQKDTTPPTIEHITVTVIHLGEALQIEAEIRDDTSPPSYIRAYVDYRMKNHPYELTCIQKWSTIVMKYDGNEDGLHVGIIKAEKLQYIFSDTYFDTSHLNHNSSWLEYKIRAVDEAGNEAVTQIYSTVLKKPGEDLPSPGNHP